MEQSLTGKIVIITGASSGFGAATARTLVRMGAKVTLAAPGDARLAAVAAELGDAALAVSTDVRVGADVVRMVEATVMHFGRVDVLFANAGILIKGPVLDGDPEAWADLMDINVNGVMRCMHAVLPYMTKQGSGDIVVTTSISGLVDIAGEPAYSASKHAIQGFVHTVRRQVAPYNIRVMSVAPGIAATELWGKVDPTLVDKKIADHTSLLPEDVVDAVIFMLTRPAHVTIRNLVILPQNQDI
ncbi:MAG: SDR family oxidoreductase [Anaerolineales bacterium]|nr:SDR family oxidoreductase [Anaerolineales bacterium]